MPAAALPTIRKAEWHGRVDAARRIKSVRAWYGQRQTRSPWSGVSGATSVLGGPIAPVFPALIALLALLGPALLAFDRLAEPPVIPLAGLPGRETSGSLAQLRHADEA